MKKYYVYHIPNFIQKDGSIGKIGTSVNPKTRVRKQKYTDYEILFVTENKDEAAAKEIQLQKEYGYRVDTIPYNVIVKIATKESRIKGGKIGGKAAGKIAVESGQIQRLGRKNVESGHLAKVQSLGGKAAGKIAVESGNWNVIAKMGSDFRKRSILQFTKDNQFIKEWSSAAEVDKELKINKSNIAKCCKGKYKSTSGYIWKYKK
jgi:hypothetical protein